MNFVKIIKLITINLITFGVLLIIINWACGKYLADKEKASRQDLPNYNQDREHARDIFKDYNSVQHRYEPFVGWKCLPYQGKTLTITPEGQRIHTPPSFSGQKKK